MGLALGAAEAGVVCYPLSMFAFDATPMAGMMLGYGLISQQGIEPGLRIQRECFG